ncbi:MAG: hypothetical protein JW737_09970 [Acidobacteria bacterium]|nr:hypothetical protein [Acidobacteriota bacterium]
MIWTFLKDLSIILLVLTIGFFASFTVEIDEDFDLIDMEKYQRDLKEEIQSIKIDNSIKDEEFAGRLNVAHFNADGGHYFRISFPFSYIMTFASWGMEGDFTVQDDWNVNIGWGMDHSTFGRNKFKLKDIAKLKIGSYIIWNSEDDGETVYIWRSRKD